MRNMESDSILFAFIMNYLHVFHGTVEPSEESFAKAIFKIMDKDGHFVGTDFEVSSNPETIYTIDNDDKYIWYKYYGQDIDALEIEAARKIKESYLDDIEFRNKKVGCLDRIISELK